MEGYATRVNLPRMRSPHRVRESANANSGIQQAAPLVANGGAATGPNATASRAARFGGAQKPSEVEEARITVKFKAGYNVVLTGGWSAQRVSRPVELEVGHARELAAKAQTTACPRMRPHEREQIASASPCHQNMSSQRPKGRH